MRQKYYCPNCGAPVVCGEQFCIGCGVNFKWIAQPEQPNPDPVKYRLPSFDVHNQPAQNQPGPDHHMGWPSAVHDPDTHGETNGPQNGAPTTPLSSEIAKLLESVFDRHARCHK